MKRSLKLQINDQNFFLFIYILLGLHFNLAEVSPAVWVSPNGSEEGGRELMIARQLIAEKSLM